MADHRHSTSAVVTDDRLEDDEYQGAVLFLVYIGNPLAEVQAVTRADRRDVLERLLGVQQFPGFAFDTEAPQNFIRGGYGMLEAEHVSRWNRHAAVSTGVCSGLVKENAIGFADGAGEPPHRVEVDRDRHSRKLASDNGTVEHP